MKEYCSWCFEKNEHTKIKVNSFYERDTFKCTNCKNYTVYCRVCNNMARVGESWTDEFCAVHNGTIRRFAPPRKKLNELAEWEKLCDPEGVNFYGYGKKIGIKAALILITVGTVDIDIDVDSIEEWPIFDFLGDLDIDIPLDEASMTLQKTVLGLAIMTAGGMGQSLFEKYSQIVQNFDFVKHKEGTGEDVIFINGFTTQSKNNLSKWEPILHDRYSTNNWYELTWESKNLVDVSHKIFNKGGKYKGFKAVGKAKMVRLGHLMILTEILGNPWSSAKYKSKITGFLLAYILLRSDWRKRYSFMVHSLGANVIFHALNFLQEWQYFNNRKLKFIKDIHIIGGACTSDPEEWRKVSKAVSGKIYNYYSNQDWALKTYNVLSKKKAMGYNGISGRVNGIRNIGVSDIVTGHSKYFDVLPEIIQNE